LSEEIVREVQVSFKKFYHDAGFPKEVRRRILEAAVRAPQDWHSASVRAAFAGGDENLQCTAVFCMQFIEGFDQQIIEALESENPDIRYEALLAAGHWELAKAWPTIARLVADPDIDKTMLLAAIDAAANIGLPESVTLLEKLLYSDDEDIVDAAHEALGMLEGDEFDNTIDEEG
jgi:HEAT repeat protein